MSEETELSQGTKLRIFSQQNDFQQTRKLQDLLNKAKKDDEEFGSEEDIEDIEEDDNFDEDEEIEEYEPINELEKKEITNEKIQETPLKEKEKEMPPVNIPFKETKILDITDYIENSNISFRRGMAIIKILEGDIKRAIELLQKEI